MIFILISDGEAMDTIYTLGMIGLMYGINENLFLESCTYLKIRSLTFTLEKKFKKVYEDIGSKFN